MSATEQKATLSLRLIGPLEGDTELPLGAAAWITSEEDEPQIVNLAGGYLTPPVNVEITPGRIVIVLRVPTGRRGQYTFIVKPGELKDITFGAPPTTDSSNTTSLFGSLEPPVGPHHPPPNVDPNIVPNRRPEPIPGDPWGTIETSGGGLGGNGGSGGGWGKPVRPSFAWPGPSNSSEIAESSWISQINTVQLVVQESSDQPNWVRHRLKRTKIPKEIQFISSSSQELQFSVSKCLGIVLQPAPPFHEKVLLHRAPMHSQRVVFKIKLRNDDAHIPFDTDIMIPDDCITPLLAFLANGDLTSAKAQAERFAQAAGNYVGNKNTNHHMAAVGAYALYLLRQTNNQMTWLYNLHYDFADISDAAILWALTVMRLRPGAIADWYDETRCVLIEASKRPLPILTIGVRMLVEGLERLSSSRRSAGDTELAGALARAQYAKNVVDYETGVVPARPREVGFFAPVHMGDKSTQQAFKYFIKPLMEAEEDAPLTALQQLQTPVHMVTGAEASREKLQQWLGGGASQPAIVWTAGHGMAFDATDPEQAALQGALLTGDWSGFNTMQREHYLAGADLGPDADLRGMVAFLFACFGAGTPQIDSYPAASGARREIAPRSFVAALPQAMLARGALGVIGHIDLAYGSSFKPKGVTSAQIVPYDKCVGHLLTSRCLGTATCDLSSRAATLGARVADTLFSGKAPASPGDTVYMWCERNDARGYVLLGDPAIRLRFS